MRKSIREKLADAKRGVAKIENMTLEEMFRTLLDGHKRPLAQRQANPTQLQFRADPAKYKAYMGPKGCSKTSTIVACGLERALILPGSQGFIARQDYNDLLTSTGKRLDEMIGRLPKGTLLDRNQSQPARVWLAPVPTLSPEGDILDDTPSQITYVGMNAMQAGGSFEANWGALDEMDEMDGDIVRLTSGWLRSAGGEYCIMGAFNPTDTFHWLYTACTGLDHQGRQVEGKFFKLFTPKPDENMRNLHEDYYKDQAKTMTEDQIVRYVKGQWGGVFKGAPVFPEFKFHVPGSDTEWHGRTGLKAKYDRFSPVFRFLDFGFRHPYCCWSQFDHLGRLFTFKEYLGTDIEIDSFIEACLAKEKQWFPDHRGDYINHGDPAARQKKDTGSTLVILGSKGWKLNYRITTIDDGLQVIRTRLRDTVDGEPLLQIDSEECPVLAGAMRGGYHRDDDGQKPVKDGYYDHAADGYRYGIVGLFGIVDNKKLTLGLPKSLEYNKTTDQNWR